jgi:hypothetical protein
MWTVTTRTALVFKMKLFTHVNRHQETFVDVMKEPLMTVDKDACVRMDFADRMVSVFLEIVIK